MPPAPKPSRSPALQPLAAEVTGPFRATEAVTTGPDEATAHDVGEIGSGVTGAVGVLHLAATPGRDADDHPPVAAS